MDKRTEDRLWKELHGLRHKIEVIAQAVTIITTKLEASEKALEAKEKERQSMINTVKWVVGSILTVAGLYIAYLSL